MSGLSATLKEDLALNVAVLYHTASIAGTTVTGTAVGATQGGLDFKPGIKTRHVEFDGKRSDVESLDYVIEYDAHITGSIIQIGAEQIAMLEPGAGLAGDIYTPRDADVLYTEDTDYLTDVMAVWQRGDGGLFVVHFPKARIVSWDIDSKDKAEAKIKIDLKAFLDYDTAVTNVSACPYSLRDIAA
jgi:hypothetical protein